MIQKNCLDFILYLLTRGANYCAWWLTYFNLFHQFFEIRYCAVCCQTVTSKQHKLNRLKRLVNMIFSFPA